MLFSLAQRAPVEWQEYLEALYQRRAPGTCRNYQKAIKRLEEVTKTGLLEVTQSQALDFINAISKTGIAAVTVQHMVYDLHSIYKRLKAADFIQRDPFEPLLDLVANARPGLVHPTQAMTAEEVKQLLESVPRVGKRNVRDRAFLALLFGGGLRISEVLNRKIKDVQKLRDGRILLKLGKTKTRDGDEKDLPEWASVDVFALYQQRIAEGAGAEYPLICNYWHHWTKPADGHCTYWAARKWLASLIARAGLPEGKYTTHSGRATSITRLLDLGVSHREVKEFSRHASIRMVELYDKRRFTGDDSPSKKLEY